MLDFPALGVSDRACKDPAGMAKTDSRIAEQITHPEPELVFGIVAPVGVDLDVFQGIFDGIIRQYGYTTNVLRLSDMVARFHTEHVGVTLNVAGEFNRINSYMTAGNKLRDLAGHGDIMALYSIAEIRKKREVGDEKHRRKPIPKTVHLLRSLKHPAEVEALRRVYGTGFLLIGLHATEKQREEYLCGKRGMTPEQAQELMKRDQEEAESLGQQTRDTFTLSDVFVQSGQVQTQLERFLDMVFGHPYTTPTRDEHAMFLAYGASLRSAQLARQVGAVVVSESGEVIGTGANDVPCFGGGQYWPDGPGKDRRDHMEGYDANDREIQTIIDNIVLTVQKTAKDIDEPKLRKMLEEGRVNDLTEYGRPVHAEMESLLACARSGVSTAGGTLYTTTFPCHNCAKHVVAAGIVRVVYVAPYPKSKALALHSDSIALDDPNAIDRVRFVPFVGVAARRYFDLFSMRLGDGLEIKRKREGAIVPWQRTGARPRIRMAPYSYLERETVVTATELDTAVERMQKAAEAARAKAAPETPPVKPA